MLIVLTIDALANRRAQDARLEAFAVLLKTGGFLACAALCMLFFLPGISNVWLPHSLVPSTRVLHSHRLCLGRCSVLLVARSFLIRIAADLWPEGVW